MVETVLVTGGAGFIGSHLVDELLNLGYKVKVVDNLSTGNMDNLAHVKDKIIFKKIDIRDFKLFKRCCNKVDYILHQAALGSVPRSIDDPVASYTTNVIGTLNVLYAAKQMKVKRVVNASSSSIYGNYDGIKIETLKGNPLSPYAVTKLSAEETTKIFYNIYGLETVSLRYFNVFGPRQNPLGSYAAVIPKFIKKMLHNEQPVINGDGNHSRDFTYVKNVVNANILAMTTPAKDCVGKTFNVGTNNNVKLNGLVQDINTLLKTDIKPLYEKERTGDVLESLADISFIKKCLKYNVDVNFIEGLKKTIEWYKKN